MNMDDLKQERDQLQKRLDWLGVRSTGYDRIERRIKEIDSIVVLTAVKAHRSDLNI